MNIGNNDTEKNSVLLVVDTTAPYQAVIENAILMARRFNSQLHALLVEDLDLVRMADLPFSIEIDRISGQVRPLDKAHVDRALKLRSMRSRQMLEQLAQQHQIEVVARTVRGNYLFEALDASLHADIAFLCRLKQRSYNRALGLYPKSNIGSVQLFYDGSPGASRALVFARRLAQAQNIRMTLVLPEVEQAARDKLQQQVDKLLEEGKDEHQLKNGYSLAGNETLSSERLSPDDLLIVSRDSSILAEQHYKDLLNSMPCTIVLVS